ncbi:hypothetical protein Tco_1339992 [Tanacetum coccineum]
MSNFLKNQGTWKLTELKKLNFEEVKTEVEKLIKQLDTYVPINLEATKESLKIFGEELQTKTAKKLKFDDESTQPTEEKVEEDKDDKPTKKTGKRRKQIARKGLHIDLDKDDSEDSDEASEKDDSNMCKAMLDKKLQGGKPDEDCYKLLKMMEKKAGIRKHKDWLVQEQTALGKDFLNPLMADNLPKIIWLSTHHICVSHIVDLDLFKLAIVLQRLYRSKTKDLQNSGDGGNTGDRGKIVGRAIGACGRGIGDSLLVVYMDHRGKVRWLARLKDP